MSLSFPQNPVLNQTTSTGNKTWTWNGKAWTITAFTGNVVISDSAPSTATQGSLWYNTSTAIMYTRLNNAWTETISGSLIELLPNSVLTLTINELAVTTSKLADNAVTNTKIADLAVNTAELADNAITNIKIAALAINTAKLADNAVTTIKIADNAIINSKIAISAITADKLADAIVTSDKLGAGAVTNIKIADGAVTTTKLNLGIAALALPIGATSDRPIVPIVGMSRWNTTIAGAEIWTGSTWYKYTP